MEQKRKLAVIIPAQDEARVIEDTLESLMRVVPLRDIYVVSDGSVDTTKWKAMSYTPNVLVLEKNVGKAQATNQIIRHFNLIQRYNYIMPMDADTKVTKSFISNALPILDHDTKKQYICVVGKVVGKRHNWITKYRMWEYEIAQSIHKAAQAVENSIIVCPGCATIYRSEIFEKESLPTGTLTEDMDFTFLIHRKRLGKIAYVNDAIVITQDPSTLREYVIQIYRWYTGFWQCILKHNIPWGGQMLDVEVAGLALEGLFNGLLMILFLFFIPVTIVTNPFLIAIPVGIDLALFLVPTLFIIGLKYKLFEVFRYIHYFYFIRLISSLIFLFSFIKVVFATDLLMRWNKVMRY